MTDERIAIETAESTADLCECEHCGNSVDATDVAEIQVTRRSTETWCVSCIGDDAQLCDSCDEHAHSDYTTRVRTSARRVSTWCESCVENGDGTVYNTDTGETGSSEYASEAWYYWESDDEYHSEPEDEEDEDELHDYGTDVIDEHRWPRITKRDALCFGVELEMEATRGRPQLISILGGRDGDGRYILKEDGSLTGLPGLELVTLPYTLDHHASGFNWPALLQPIAKYAQSGSNTHKCGIHVHVNRAALSPLQIGKALVFLNCESNSDFITCVAQRASNGYCERDRSKKITNGGDTYCDRRDILNISNEETVEFRLFRGNIRPERVLKNIEFCHALMTYCATASVREIESSRPFCDWLGKRTKTYPHLTRFLRERGYLPERRPIPPQYASTAAPAVVDA